MSAEKSFLAMPDIAEIDTGRGGAGSRMPADETSTLRLRRPDGRGRRNARRRADTAAEHLDA